MARENPEIGSCEKAVIMSDVMTCFIPRAIYFNRIMPQNILCQDGRPQGAWEANEKPQGACMHRLKPARQLSTMTGLTTVFSYNDRIGIAVLSESGWCKPVSSMAAGIGVKAQ